MGQQRKRRGNSLIEFSFLVPWYVFLFVGTFDFGFYIYALIATQNAAIVGAEFCSGSDTAATDWTTACSYVKGQFNGLPNVDQSGANTCSASPLTGSAVLNATGADGNPSTTVTVTYTTPQLIPIPGLLPGILTITRSVEMRVRS